MNRFQRFFFPVVLALVVPVSAQAERVTFDELSYRVADGVSLLGLTFDFKHKGVDSYNAWFGSRIASWSEPRELTGLSGALLRVEVSGVLTLAFEQPVTSLSFNVARQAAGSVPGGVQVELLAPGGVSLGTVAIDLAPLSWLPEGSFAYAGEPIAAVAVTYPTLPVSPSGSTGLPLLMDNIAWDHTPLPAPTAAPAPASAWLFGSGAASLAALAWRRRERNG